MEFVFGDHQITIHPLGSTIISWKFKGTEKLFLSKKAVLDGTKPIRGGIPIVFPQFGTGPIMEGQHGFARRVNWSLKSVTHSHNSMTICMQLKHSEESLKLWPHEFTLNYTVTVVEHEPSLNTKLEVVNTGQSPFTFTALLHSYFCINDISKVQLFGQFPKYFDKLSQQNIQDQPTLLLPITGEIDRIYGGVEGPFRIIEKIHDELNFEFLIETDFNDLVVWNPWAEKSKTMSDFDEQEYKQMICVESGNVINPVMLVPGETWKKEQRITSFETNPCF